MRPEYHKQIIDTHTHTLIYVNIYDFHPEIYYPVLLAHKRIEGLPCVLMFYAPEKWPLWFIDARK